jgi:hypothetical protein
VDLLALFTPEDEPGLRWRVRLFPPGIHTEIAGLSDSGERSGLGLPDYVLLDQLMLRERGGYMKGLHPSGVTEVSVTEPNAARALCTWVTELIAASSTDPTG